MEKDVEKVARYTFPVEPAEGNAQQELPLTLLVTRLLESATLHAEAWGVGYSTLVKDRHAWVLARLAVGMERYPAVNDTLTVETWIEGYNRHFSARNFCFRDGKGAICGYARTVWSVINMDTRQSVDLTALENLDRHVADRECPIGRPGKLKEVADDDPVRYTVRYSDIDLNRHVNSVKCIGHLLDLFPLSVYDTHLPAQFDISYLTEGRYGMNLFLKRKEYEPGVFVAEMETDRGEVLCRARIVFKPR